MKRPQGFDRQVTERHSVSVDSPGDSAPHVSTPQADTHNVQNVPDRPDEREIRRALRLARRERRRAEHDEVRRFTSRTRHRRLVWFTALGVFLALVITVVALGLSPALSLRTITVLGTSTVNATDVEKALSSQMGRPLMTLDSTEISRQLAAFPRIRSYTLEIVPPHTLVVRVVEREPLGVIRQGNAYVIVDAAKVALASSQNRPAQYPLMSVSGDSSAGFSAVVSVLEALPDSLRARVDTISAQTADNVSFTLRDSGTTVLWGNSEQSELKAADLEALLTHVPGKSVYDVSSPLVVTTQ